MNLWLIPEDETGHFVGGCQEIIQAMISFAAKAYSTILCGLFYDF